MKRKVIVPSKISNWNDFTIVLISFPCSTEVRSHYCYLLNVHPTLSCRYSNSVLRQPLLFHPASNMSRLSIMNWLFVQYNSMELAHLSKTLYNTHSLVSNDCTKSSKQVKAICYNQNPPLTFTDKESSTQLNKSPYKRLQCASLRCSKPH